MNKLMYFSKEDYIFSGQELCSTNIFYNTLRLILRYSLLGSKDGTNLFDLIKAITTSELDFKTYTVYNEYGLYLYRSEVMYVFHHGSNVDEITYFLVYLIKMNYEKDKEVLEPFISKVEVKSEEIALCYRELKTANKNENRRKSTTEMVREATELLETAHQLDVQSMAIREKALEVLRSISDRRSDLQIENIRS